MAREVKSDQWTGTPSGEGAASSSSHAPQVCGEFHSRDRLDEAMSKLEGSLFQRADLSLRRVGQGDSTPDAAEETPAREDDVQNVRQLAVGMGGFVGAAAAAGAVVATGGAALPAVGAAAAALGATQVAGEAVGQAAAPEAQAEIHRAADEGGVVLMVHADTPERQAKAEELMQACGATKVWRQNTA
jgi:hypothetical protein